MGYQVKRRSSDMSPAAVVSTSGRQAQHDIDGFGGSGHDNNSSTGPRISGELHRSSPVSAGPAVGSNYSPHSRTWEAHNNDLPRLSSVPRHPARPWDMPPPVNFMDPTMPPPIQRDTFDRQVMPPPLSDRHLPQLPSPAQLYGTSPAGYPPPPPQHTAHSAYGSSYTSSYSHPSYPHQSHHQPGISASYDPVSILISCCQTCAYECRSMSIERLPDLPDYGADIVRASSLILLQASASHPPPRSASGDPGLPPPSHLRPTSGSWDYGYQSMASIKPQDHGQAPEYRGGGGGAGAGEGASGYRTFSPRTVNPSLPHPPPRGMGGDPYEPFFPDDGTAGYMSSTSPADLARSGGLPHSQSHLNNVDGKARRTSLESGMRSSRVQQQTHQVTSRLGLDPVAKQERRREQNRLAQRAFRARAKQREQDKVRLVVCVSRAYHISFCFLLVVWIEHRKRHRIAVSDHAFPSTFCVHKAGINSFVENQSGR